MDGEKNKKRVMEVRAVKLPGIGATKMHVGGELNRFCCFWSSLAADTTEKWLTNLVSGVIKPKWQRRMPGLGFAADYLHAN